MLILFKVRCVKPRPGLQLGKTYNVTRQYEYDGEQFYRLDESEDDEGFFSSRFEKVIDPPMSEVDYYKWLSERE